LAIGIIILLICIGLSGCNSKKYIYGIQFEVKNEWHELIADLLIEIRDKLDEINKKLEG